MFASLAAAVIPSVISYIGSSERNDQQADAASGQMAFQQANSDSSYQRAVRDLKGAGLNPMLAYMHGGASTPSGAMANFEDTLTPAVNTGVSAYRASTEGQVRQQQVSNIAADTGLKSAATAKTTAETEVAKTQAALNIAETERVQSQVGVNNAQTAFTRTNEQYVSAQIQKVAPEIRKLVSEAHLNDQMKQKLLAELPLIAAQVQKTSAETETEYQRKLLMAVETTLGALKYNESKSHSDMYDTAYGRALPYVNSGAKAIGDVTGSITPWAFLFKK